MITLLNHDIPGYGLMMSIGFIGSLAYISAFSKIHKEDTETLIYIYVLGAVAALVGAKILYLLTVIRQISFDAKTIGLSDTVAKYVNGGFVFYGGLIAALISTIYWCKGFKKDMDSVLMILLPALLITAGFGRIGCSLAGCCYGTETESQIYIMYEQSGIAPNHIHLVPTQIYEAVLDFALAVIFTLTAEKKKGRYLLVMYLLIYSVFRFILEFFRGDAARGFILGLSTSQWISLVILSLVMIYILNNRKNQKLLNHP